ncbi:hypothetical protein P606_02780 [Comamonas thiooxydans]|nr:hypothetical protein [Comamonas thiooxydans]KGH29359.1 hypothetical protein P606_02780 [Comamonas thiooxydans]
MHRTRIALAQQCRERLAHRRQIGQLGFDCLQLVRGQFARFGTGIFFTPWRFDGALLASGVITVLAALYLWLLFRRGAVSARELVAVSGLYAVFVILEATLFAG